jgi:hypothetical protein
VGGQAAVIEVHGQEGDVAEHVRPAHALVELDPVENKHALIDERHVAKVHIAMALADPTLGSTLCKFLA